MSLIALLQRPPPRPDLGLAWDRFWRWERQGLSYLLPHRWRAARFRPRYRLVTEEPDSAPLTIERSLFGLTRMRAPTDNDAHLPARIALPAADVFVTEIDLPKDARGRLDDAVAFRLEEASPLPIDDVLVATAPPEETPGGRLRVPVALTRKTTIDEVKRRHPAHTIAEIGAEPQIDGALRFRFQGTQSGKPTRLWRDAAALCLGLAALIVGALHHLERRDAALREERTELLAAIKTHHAKATPFLATKEDLSPEIDGAAALRDFAAFTTKLPRPSFIESVEASAKGVSIVVFIRTGAEAPEGAAVVTREAQRRGFTPYAVTLPLGSPEERAQ